MTRSTCLYHEPINFTMYIHPHWIRLSLWWFFLSCGRSCRSGSIEVAELLYRFHFYFVPRKAIKSCRPQKQGNLECLFALFLFWRFPGGLICKIEGLFWYLRLAGQCYQISTIICFYLLYHLGRFASVWTNCHKGVHKRYLTLPLMDIPGS